MKTLALCFVLTACGTLRQRNHVAGGVAGALLACDYGQTVAMASAGWGDASEHNALLGSKPSVPAVTAYFAAIAVVSGASVKLPEWARGALYSMVIVGQGAMVLGNRYLVDRGTWCGL